MSMLKAMLMQKKGGTLQLESVGGATYDSNYIFENDGSSKYFQTIYSYDITSNWVVGKTIETKIKFMPTAGYSGIFSWDKANSGYVTLGGYVYSNGTSYEVSLYGNTSNVSCSLNTWYYIKAIQDSYVANNITFIRLKFYYSIDDITYTLAATNSTQTSNEGSAPINFGYAKRNGTERYFYGKIDFKECYIKIDGTDILWS